ncbi:MAG: hypothetical protein FWE21_04970 [Defluviitaleaceae bacterium]|nr:hypothetical protein [Defluviitaleaceae bacterium]
MNNNVHKFKYGRSWLTVTLMLPAIAIAFALMSIVFYFFSDNQINAIVGILLFIAIFLGAYIPMRIWTDATATATIHKTHADLTLGNKERKLEYQHITRVIRTFHLHGNHWRIDIKGEPSVYMDEPILPKDRKEIREFMEEMRRRTAFQD